MLSLPREKEWWRLVQYIFSGGIYTEEGTIRHLRATCMVSGSAPMGDLGSKGLISTQNFISCILKFF